MQEIPVKMCNSTTIPFLWENCYFSMKCSYLNLSAIFKKSLKVITFVGTPK